MKISYVSQLELDRVFRRGALLRAEQRAEDWIILREEIQREGVRRHHRQRTIREETRRRIRAERILRSRRHVLRLAVELADKSARRKFCLRRVLLRRGALPQRTCNRRHHPQLPNVDVRADEWTRRTAWTVVRKPHRPCFVDVRRLSAEDDAMAGAVPVCVHVVRQQSACGLHCGGEGRVDPRKFREVR